MTVSITLSNNALIGHALLAIRNDDDEFPYIVTVNCPFRVEESPSEHGMDEDQYDTTLLDLLLMVKATIEEAILPLVSW